MLEILHKWHVTALNKHINQLIMRSYFKYITIVCAFLLATGNIVTGQSLDEIIDAHIKAHGGAEKWSKVESMKITGKFTAFSIEDDYLAIKTKCGSYYAELSLGDKRVIEAFDGKKGWTIDPWHEITYPRELNKNEVNVFLQKAEFISPFFNYKEKGLTAELLGKDNFEGIDVWKIKLTRPNGKWETWFLDAETYLEVKYNSMWVDFARPAPAATFFDDFRDFDGLVIPCFVERTFYQRDRILIIEDIEFNVETDCSMFKMPKSNEMVKLAFMEGNWNVTIDAWSRRANRWYNVDSTQSEIEFEGINLLTEEICHTNVYVQNQVINFSYNSNDEEYLISVYDGFRSTMDLFTGEFTDSTFVVTNKIAECDTVSNPVVKIEYGKFTPNSFEATILNTFDQGNTWNATQRLIYVRDEE